MGRPVKDIVGQTFGRLTVISRDGHIGVRAAWFCRCECGRERRATTTDLQTKTGPKSCGCYRKGPTAYYHRHGHSPQQGASATYFSWQAMLSRCGNPQNQAFKYYGGRGVTVCDRWRDFNHFLEDMGERPAGLTLDRIDPYGNYEPANCRWADAQLQSENTRRSIEKRARLAGAREHAAHLQEAAHG